MSTRYGDRGFGRYGDPEDERAEERDYERGEGRAYGDAGERYTRGSDYGPPRRGGYASARGGDYDYGRDYGYGRDYSTRDQTTRDQTTAREFGSRYGSREYGGGGEYGARYGRERLAGGGGYAGAAPRRHEGEDYGREQVSRSYGRDYERGERGRARHPAEAEGVRDYDTDYGRTTSRFYGRSGYEYGRDDDDRDDDDRDERRGYRAHGYAGRGDEREGGGSWLDRAADQVRSWFGGDEDADERGGRGRREEMRGAQGRGKFRGLGPRNYRRPDERVREEVCERLTDNEWLDASEVECNVVAGEVILTGTVDSRYAKRLAENIAESVSGVTNVQNNLRVQGYEATRPDAATAALPEADAGEVTAVSGMTAAPSSDANDPDTPGLSSRAAGGS